MQRHEVRSTVCARTANHGGREEDRVLGRRVVKVKFQALRISRGQMVSGVQKLF